MDCNAILVGGDRLDYYHSSKLSSMTRFAILKNGGAMKMRNGGEYMNKLSVEVERSSDFNDILVDGDRLDCIPSAI